MPPPNRDPAKICQIGVGRLLSSKMYGSSHETNLLGTVFFMNSLCGIIVGRPLASIWLLAKCDATNHHQGMHLALHSTMGEQGPFRSAGRVFLDGHQWVLSCAETDFMGIPWKNAFGPHFSPQLSWCCWWLHAVHIHSYSIYIVIHDMFLTGSLLQMWIIHLVNPSNMVDHILSHRIFYHPDTLIAFSRGNKQRRLWARPSQMCCSALSRPIFDGLGVAIWMGTAPKATSFGQNPVASWALASSNLAGGLCKDFRKRLDPNLSADFALAGTCRQTMVQGEIWLLDQRPLPRL